MQWYRDTSAKMSKALGQQRAAMKRGEITPGEYEVLKGQVARARKTLQNKALYGPRYPTKADYVNVNDIFELFFPDEDWDDLYGYTDVD